MNQIVISKLLALFAKTTSINHCLPLFINMPILEIFPHTLSEKHDLKGAWEPKISLGGKSTLDSTHNEL